MSVPRTREPQKIPVSQIARGLSFLVILMFMQSNYPSAKNIKPAPKDFLDSRDTNGPMARLEDSQRVSGLTLLRFSDLWHLQ